MQMNRKLWTVPALTLAMFLGGCGGEGNSSSESTPATTPSTTPATSQTTDSEVIPTAMQAFADDGAVVVIHIDSNDRMQYDTDRFEVPAGAMVRVVLTHSGQLPAQNMGHNVVILNQGLDPFDFGADVSEQNGSLDNEYVPSVLRDRVVAFTPIIGGGETTQVEFKAPDAAGDYPFLCSFPGHAGMMNGIMVVQ